MMKLSSSLPKEYDDEGLSSINGQLVTDPQDIHVVIALINCKSVTTDCDTGFDIATARILHIEPIGDQEAAFTAREMLANAQEARTGKKPLPLTAEQLDPGTGELTPADILRHGAGYLGPGGTVTVIKP